MRDICTIDLSQVGLEKNEEGHPHCIDEWMECHPTIRNQIVEHLRGAPAAKMVEAAEMLEAVTAEEEAEALWMQGDRTEVYKELDRVVEIQSQVPPKTVGLENIQALKIAKAVLRLMGEDDEPA